MYILALNRAKFILGCWGTRATDPLTIDQNLGLMITVQHCERISHQISKLALERVKMKAAIEHIWLYHSCEVNVHSHIKKVNPREANSFLSRIKLPMREEEEAYINSSIKVTNRSNFCPLYVLMNTKDNWLEIVTLKILNYLHFVFVIIVFLLSQ